MAGLDTGSGKDVGDTDDGIRSFFRGEQGEGGIVGEREFKAGDIDDPV